MTRIFLQANQQCGVNASISTRANHSPMPIFLAAG